LLPRDRRLEKLSRDESENGIANPFCQKKNEMGAI
jgi:hypothetical protein